MVSIIIHREEFQRAEGMFWWMEWGRRASNENECLGGRGWWKSWFWKWPRGHSKGQGGINSVHASRWCFTFYSCSSKPPLLQWCFHWFTDFNWRIITLQFCDDFCHTSTWIGHSQTCVPSLLNPLPPPCQLPPCKLSQSTTFGLSASYIKLPLAIYFTYGNAYVSTLFSQIIPWTILSWNSVGQKCNTSLTGLKIKVSAGLHSFFEIQRKNHFPSFPCIPWLMAPHHPSPTSAALHLSDPFPIILSFWLQMEVNLFLCF